MLHGDAEFQNNDSLFSISFRGLLNTTDDFQEIYGLRAFLKELALQEGLTWNTPICVPDDPPAKRAKRTKEPVSPSHDAKMASEDAKDKQESSIESNSDSSESNSDFSSEDGPSDVSDLDKFEEAYHEFGRLTEGVDVLDLDRNLAGNKSDDVPGLLLEGGLDTLQTLANVPKTWPLARLTVPLSGFSEQLERLIEGYCMEIYATNAQPDQHLMSIFFFSNAALLKTVAVMSLLKLSQKRSRPLLP